MSNQQSKRGRYSYDDIEADSPNKKYKYGQESIGACPWESQTLGHMLPTPNSLERSSAETQSVHSTDTLNPLPVTPSTTPTKASYGHKRSNDTIPGGIPYTSWWENPQSSMAAPVNEYSHSGTYPFACENFTAMSNGVHINADMMPSLQTAQDPNYLAPFYQTFPTPQALPGIPYPTPVSEFDPFSPCESPESAVFQSPTALSSPTEMYFRNAAMPTNFSATASIAATQDYTQNIPSHCLATRILGPMEWSFGLGYLSKQSNTNLHSCLPQVSAILGKLKQRRGAVQGSSPTAHQGRKAEAGGLRETISMSRESTEQVTRILNCGCLSKDATLTRFIIATIFEIMSNYSRIARGIIGDQVRADGQVRARVGMILGELPNISHFIDLLANRWYQAHHASDSMMTAQDMLSKQDENYLSPLAFSQLEGKLRQRLQAVTHEIMKYCGRA